MNGDGGVQIKSLAGFRPGFLGNASLHSRIENPAEDTMRVPHLLGRLLFGGYFIASGVNHFRNARELARYAATKKVPKPDLAVQLPGAALIAGGTSILLAAKPNSRTPAIISFPACSTPVTHDFSQTHD